MLDEKIQKEIEDISKQIVEKYKPQKLILFGSAAWGKTTPDSDLDFLIIKKNIPYLGRDRMREISRLIKRDSAVDFLVYKPEEVEQGLKDGDPFLKIVMNKGKVLYG